MIWQIFRRIFLSQETRHGEKFNEATWPAVEQNDGYGILPLRKQGYKMNSKAFDFNGVIGKRVDVLLLSAPVILMKPIILSLSDPLMRNSKLGFVLLGGFVDKGTDPGQFQELCKIGKILI
tara:strand:- start:1153 stop:1515 length:363 start_codon:yes stop_codon:yes gene_type:complete